MTGQASAATPYLSRTWGRLREEGWINFVKVLEGASWIYLSRSLGRFGEGGWIHLLGDGGRQAQAWLAGRDGGEEGVMDVLFRGGISRH